jgi:hypothetical protein
VWRLLHVRIPRQSLICSPRCAITRALFGLSGFEINQCDARFLGGLTASVAPAQDERDCTGIAFAYNHSACRGRDWVEARASRTVVHEEQGGRVSAQKLS